MARTSDTEQPQPPYCGAIFRARDVSTPQHSVFSGDPQAIAPHSSPASRCYFFGHQSVGEDILQGIAQLPRDESSLTIAESGSATPRPGLLLHARVGRNHDPLSKIDAFAAALEQQPDGAIDVALMKFCYVDINGTTDVDRLFEQYLATLTRLTQRHPQIRFVHVTVPLRTVQGKLWCLIQRLRGKDWSRAFRDNAARYRYNERLRTHCREREPLFDLARLESTAPNGSRCVHRVNGTPLEALVPDYTHDGGHLSTLGKQIMATAFLKFLATLDQPKNS